MKNGDIWLVDLSDAKGHEQRGIRPAIIAGNANGIDDSYTLHYDTEHGRIFAHSPYIPDPA